MIDTTLKPNRILMRDGQWLVPPEERPKGWERYGLSEPAPITNPAAPTEEQVAGVMADIAVQVAADLPQPIAEAASTPAVIDKKQVLREYAREYQRTTGRHRREFKQLVPVILQSAEHCGCDSDLTCYGKLLIAGLWCKSTARLGDLAGLPFADTLAAAKRFINAGIWTLEEKAYLIHIGDECEIPDLGFWLNAMVGAGMIQGRVTESGVFYAANGIQMSAQAGATA